MKVLIVSPVFSPDKSVGAVRMGSLSAYLLKHGHNVSVITNAKSESVCSNGIRFYFVESAVQVGYRAQFKEYGRRYAECFLATVKADRPAIVIISGGPFYTFSLAKLSHDEEIPVILDFRDPWIFDTSPFRNPGKLKTLASKLLELPIERSAVRAASAVVTVTEGWKKSFERYYPFCRDKFKVISNGYDDELLKNLEKKDFPRDKKILIGVFGKIFYYSEHYSEEFLRGINPYLADVSVLQIGEVENNCDTLKERCGAKALQIESTGFLPYKDGMETLMNCDAFLIIDSRKDALGTKLYDYLFLNKPILFVGPKKSAIGDVLMSYRGNYVCETQYEVAKALESIISGEVQNSCVDVGQFARSEQNKKWFKLLETCINRQ